MSIPEPPRHALVAALTLLLGLGLLATYLALPWICLVRFGSLAAVAGAIASHVLYVVTLKPRGSICLGMPWALVAGNIVAVVLAAGVRLLWVVIAAVSRGA